MKILVISDIHGNASALKAVLNAEQDADKIIFLGDALLSGPQANETMTLLDDLSIDIAIMGNHDEEVLDPTIYAKWPPEWVALNNWIVAQLDSGAEEKLKRFTRNGHYEIGGINLYLHHGELEKGEPAALPNAPDATFAKLDPGNETNLSCWPPRSVPATDWRPNLHNPGSVGQPRWELHACYEFIDGLIRRVM